MPREDAVRITPLTIDSTFADLDLAARAHLARYDYLARIRNHEMERRPYRVHSAVLIEVLLLEAVFWWMRPTWVLDMEWPLYITVAFLMFPRNSKRTVLAAFQPLTPRRAWPHLTSLDKRCE
jgi:hypothetical protein